MEFHPAVLTVAAGDTVVWVNRDIVPHTATATGGTKWDTGQLTHGQSVPFTPTWQPTPLLLNPPLPRPAAAASTLSRGGVGARKLCWYSRSAGSFDVTRSGACVTLIPRRASAKLPWPCICVTATYAFQ